MPVAIKKGLMKYKNGEGEYIGLDTIAERTTQEQIDAIEEKGEDILESLPETYTELVQTVAGKVAKPLTSPNGTSGQVLQTNGDGTTTWVNVSSGGVSDVQVNSTSIVSNGVAEIPIASTSDLGVVKAPSSTGGVAINDNTGVINTNPATAADIKAGTSGYKPVVPYRQHDSVFYGLAKAAGDTTQAESSNAVGTYTDGAKTAIKTMLGISSGGVSDVQIDGTSIVSSGVASVPIADTADKLGLVKVGAYGGLTIANDGKVGVNFASATVIKQGTSQTYSTAVSNQHASAFYGLAKAAGDTTQSSSSNAVGTYTDDAKAAIKTMLGISSLPTVTSSDNGKFMMVDNGAWAAVTVPTWQGGSY